MQSPFELLRQALMRDPLYTKLTPLEPAQIEQLKKELSNTWNGYWKRKVETGEFLDARGFKLLQIRRDIKKGLVVDLTRMNRKAQNSVGSNLPLTVQGGRLQHFRGSAANG
jgi:hypothetical protein